MEYGPKTESYFAQFDSGAVFSAAVQWNADAFTVPFPERLIDMIEEYCDIPSGPAPKKNAIYELVAAGAAERNIPFSRTTLSAWLDGERDPSITGGEDKTRENIYRLAAALDFDFELTCELFDKVFFARAFNPKNLQEISWFYFAKKEWNKGAYGSGWYEKGLRAAEIVAASDSESPETKPITETSLIMNAAEALEEEEFLAFLKENGVSFSRANQSMAARELVREYAEVCSGGQSIAYDGLITEIIGYSQRDESNAAGPLSGIHSLPAQLTANFPTGRILRAICLNREDSFDKISKMLKLLLFYAFFKNRGDVESESLFKDFIAFANHELESVGFVDLYPGQPYDGMLLFCAADDAPVEALRAYISRAAAAEAAEILGAELSAAFPDASQGEIDSALSGTGMSRFLTGLLCRNRAAVNLADLPEEPDEILQYIYDEVSFSGSEKAVLRYMTIIPPDGIPKALFDVLFAEYAEAASSLIDAGWIDAAGKTVTMDYRIRELINGQIDFPVWENCREFVLRVEEECKKREDAAERKSLASVIRRASRLDGCPKSLNIQ